MPTLTYGTLPVAGAVNAAAPVTNAFQAVQSVVNAIDAANFGAGKIFAPNKIAQAGATAQQLLAWNGTDWAPWTRVEPKCLLVNAINPAVPNNFASPTGIPFDTEQVDSDTMHDGTNPSRITIKTGGFYLFTAAANFGQGNNAGTRNITLRLNGSLQLTANEQPGSNLAQQALTLSFMQQVAVNDYAEVMPFQNSGGSLTLTSTYFAAVRLSA